MDVLSDILSHMKLAGTLYFRTSFASPWSVRVPSFENVARFHYARRGRCFVRVDPAQPAQILEQGDLIIITRGAAHTLYCDPANENKAVMIDRVVEDSGFNGSGTLIFGESDSGHETQLICGHFAFASDTRHPLIDSLPDTLHLKDYGESAGTWIENTLRVIGAEAGNDQLGGELIARKLSEILFAQALRAYLNGAGAEHEVMAGFADRRIASVLTAVHKDPAFNWTLDGLAEVAGMSRTAFVNRFTRTMSSTPMGYITHWRMQLARERLIEGTDPIVFIAESAGYQSEAAFGRVFKRFFGVAPAACRREARAVGVERV